MQTPNYQKIYEDMLRSKGLEEIREIPCFKKCNDIIKFNNLISDKKDKALVITNQRSKAYDEESILEILNYQKKHGFNDSELSRVFKLSRNTIYKWKKVYN